MKKIVMISILMMTIVAPAFSYEEGKVSDLSVVGFMKALVVVQAAHTGGHFVAASQDGISASLHGMAEHYNNPTSFKVMRWRVDNESQPGSRTWGHLVERVEVETISAPLRGLKSTDIHGGGFTMQDQVTRSSGDLNYYLANAAIKMMHIAGLPERSSRDIALNSGGDIASIERASGNKYVKELLVASALADMSKLLYPSQNLDVSFTTLDQNMPGLMVSIFLDNDLMPVWK